MSDERRFTRDDANAELDELRERLPRVRRARQDMIAASRRITEEVAVDGGGVAGGDWFRHQQTLREDLEYLASRGILLRDAQTGLVDFPAVHEGRRVFLCWRLGEDEVNWFHEEHGGLGGRKPL